MANASDDPLIRIRLHQLSAILQNDKAKALELEAQAGPLSQNLDRDQLTHAQGNAAEIQKVGWSTAEFPTLSLARAGAWQGSPAYAQEHAIRMQQFEKLGARDLAGAIELEAQLVAILAGRPPNVESSVYPASRMLTEKIVWTPAQFPTLSILKWTQPIAAVVSTWPDQPPAPASATASSTTGTATGTSTSTGTSTGSSTVVSTWPDQIPVDASGVPVNASAAAALYAQLTGKASTAASSDAVPPPAPVATPSASRVLPWLLAAGAAAAAYFT